MLYDVTGAEVLQCYDESYGIEWPDGPYQLMATGEWRMRERDSIPQPDLEAYFGVMAMRGSWCEATPSEWSVAEHPGKAMLWAAGEFSDHVEYDQVAGRHYTFTSGPIPCLLGESTWTAIKRNHPGCVVEWQPNGGAGTFRFYDAEVGLSSTFAYAAGIEIPEGQEDIAYEIARALDSTGNRGLD